MTIGLFSENDAKMAGYFMGMHRDLRMIKLIIVIITSAELICMTINYKPPQMVAYISDDKFCKRCYILLRIMFPCPSVICLDEGILSGIGKVYY